MMDQRARIKLFGLGIALWMASLIAGGIAYRYYFRESFPIPRANVESPPRPIPPGAKEAETPPLPEVHKSKSSR